MCRDVFVKVESIRVVPLFCLVLLVGVGWCREASYTNDWIVELEAEADPDVVAEAHGFHNKGKVRLPHSKILLLHEMIIVK